MQSLFVDLGIIIIIAAVVGLIARMLKQPLIPAYILAGILLIPLLKYVPESIALHTQVLDFINILSEVGIAFLLFIVGLELDLKKLRDIGPIASFGTLIQFVLLFFIGYGLAVGFHLSMLIGVYIGLLVAFSSTMVVVKLLSDKRELETLHGRIVIGMMLMQDVLAVVALTVLQSVNQFEPNAVLFSLLGGILLVIGAWILGKFVFPKLFAFAARNQEFLFILSLAVCFSFALLFQQAGFSLAIGAFVAGVTLAMLPYSHEISGKIKSLKDFFLILFFISLGAQLVLSNFISMLFLFIILLLVIVLLKPLLTLIISSIFGYTKRTSTLTGLSMGQVSEFSIILAMQGIALGHFGAQGDSLYSMIILLTLASIAATSYFIKYDDQIYAKVKGFAQFFEKFSFSKKEFTFVNEEPNHEIVLIGADRMGYSIIKALQKQKKDFLVIDYNPDIIKRLMDEKVHCLYGDIGDTEIMEHLHVKTCKMVISTAPDMHENQLLLKTLKSRNPDLLVILSTSYIDDALILYQQGADYVIIPHYLGGEHLSLLLEDHGLDLDKLIDTRIAHIRELRTRHEGKQNH